MEWFLVFALLACPAVMGLMMWSMNRRQGGARAPQEDRGGPSVEALRDEQVRLTAEIDRLEAERRTGARR